VNASNPKAVIRASHRLAAGAFLEALEGPFRRQQLAAVLYPHTSPRSRPAADRLAQVIMVELSGSGSIQRHGHLHWVKVSKERVLRSGRVVPELDEQASLSLNTRCPQKWAAVDLETGEVWMGNRQGWRRASVTSRREVVECLRTQD
jgi:hypothetical protein